MVNTRSNARPQKTAVAKRRELHGSVTSRMEKKQKVQGNEKEGDGWSKNFRSLRQSLIYEDKFLSRPVMRGRPFQIHDFVDFPFSKWLIDCGLKEFLQVEEDVYPDLVRMFYCNCFTNPSDSIAYTYVKGVNIPLHDEMMKEVFDIPIWEGEAPQIASKEDSFTFLSGDAEKGKEASRLTTRDLRTLNMKLLHYVTVNNLFPRAGSVSEVSIHDAHCLYAHEKGILLEVSIDILDHMAKCRNRKNGALPYGMAITRILKHFGVDLSGEQMTKHKKADRIYSNVIGRLGYLLNKDTNEWLPKTVKEGINEDDELPNQSEAPKENEEGAPQERDNTCKQDEQTVTDTVHSRADEQMRPNAQSRIEDVLNAKFEEMKRELMSHISHCVSTCMVPVTPGVSHYSPVVHAMNTPTSIVATPTSIIATPTSVIDTPTATPSITLAFAPAMATPTEVLLSTSKSPDAVGMSQAESHSPESSPSFAHLAKRENVFSDASGSGSIARLTKAVEQVLEQVSRIDKRLAAVENVLQQDRQEKL